MMSLRRRMMMQAHLNPFVNPDMWISGTRNEASPAGSGYDSTYSTFNILNRITTRNLISVFSGDVISVSSEYVLFILWFDDEMKYSGKYSTWNNSVEITGEYPYVGIIVKNINNSTISIEEAHLINMKITR